MSFIIRGITNFVGSIVPCFFSYKSLKKPTNVKLTYWVQYWTVYSAFLALNWVAETFFISCFIPFYEFFCLLFVIFINLPHVGGATFVYKKVLAPFIRKKERKLDNIFGNIISSIWKYAPTMISSVINKTINSISYNSSAFNLQNDFEEPSVFQISKFNNSFEHFISRMIPQNIEVQEDEEEEEKENNYEITENPDYCNLSRQVTYDTDDEIEEIVQQQIKKEIEDDDFNDDSIHFVNTSKIDIQKPNKNIVRPRRRGTNYEENFFKEKSSSQASSTRQSPAKEKRLTTRAAKNRPKKEKKK